MMKKLSRNIFILETTLFVINFYFGIYSLFDMIPDKINIKLYHLLFRDDEKNTWKYPNYMEWACEYQMNPRYSILLTIVIFVFSILVVKHSRNEKGWNCQGMCSQRIPKILDRQISGSVMSQPC